jgi:hypothetical protein
MFDASSTLLLSVIASSALLAVILLAVQMTLFLWFKRLHADLLKVDQSLQLCASLLHKIAGNSSTGEFLELERGT